jgi:hypothetical protein
MNISIVVQQQKMDVVKLEPDPDGKSYPTSCHDENQPIDAKEDHDPLLTRFAFMKTENEVSCLFSH